MTHGRVEVFNDDEHNHGAVIARFTCGKASTEHDPRFVAFTKMVCTHLYETEGNYGQLSRTQEEEILEAKTNLEQALKDNIELTDVEYIEL